jgi:hypothetical protein
MKEEITICNRKENGSLTVVDVRILTVELNKNDMELYAELDGKSYKVQGDFYCQYIVVNS